MSGYACPKCSNKGFKPSEDIKDPVTVTKTTKFKTFTQRYRACYNCGYRWKTVEKFDSEVDPGLFDKLEN